MHNFFAFQTFNFKVYVCIHGHSSDKGERDIFTRYGPHSVVIKS